MDETFDVVVVGGGLAGLTAAATVAAARPGHSVLLVDSQPAGRGGRAATDDVGRFRFNRGAHALYRTTPGRAVLRRLGVEVAGHAPPIKGALGRLGDRVGLLPISAPALARTDLLGGRDKVRGGRILAGARRWRPTELAGMTAAQWFDDLGVDGALRQLCEALCRLTGYVADVEVASADLVAAQIQAALTGSVDYLDHGWASLVDGLAAAGRRHGVLHLDGGVRVHAVTPDGGRVRVDLRRSGRRGEHDLRRSGGRGEHGLRPSGPRREDDAGRRGPRGSVDLADRALLARQVVLAAGPPDANAALLPEAPGSWAGLAGPVRAACLDLGLATVPANSFLLGIDRPLYLSRHAPPGAMAPDGGAVYQTLRYLRADEDPSPAQARDELAEHCRVAGIDPEDAEESRYLHRMVVCGGLPTPASGGLAGRPGVATGLDGVLVAGDWVGPAGHLADASLVSGELAGRAAAMALDREVTARATA